MQNTASTRRSRRALLAASFVFTLTLVRAEGQWSSTTYQPSQPVYQNTRLIVHDNGLGIQAFSPSAGKWTTVSPPGSTIRSMSDGVLVTEEADGLLRAYSARLNASASQAVTPGALGAFVFTNGETVLVIDNVPTGISVLRAYSAVLNAWTSVVPPMPYTSGTVGERVAAVVVGTGYYGYSALRGQWAPISGAAPAQFATSKGNLITAELGDDPPRGQLRTGRRRRHAREADPAGRRAPRPADRVAAAGADRHRPPAGAFRWPRGAGRAVLSADLAVHERGDRVHVRSGLQIGEPVHLVVDVAGGSAGGLSGSSRPRAP